MNTQIENELGRTREMHEFVVDQLAGQYPSDDRRDLFARFLSIAQSHHEAIMTLCFQERLIGSAYALFRPLVEATNRGLFAAHAGEAWGRMCGFTHGGLEQLNRRMGDKGEIGCHFEQEDVERLLASSTSVLVRTAIQFLGAMDRQAACDAVSAKYIALYPVPEKR